MEAILMVFKMPAKKFCRLLSVQTTWIPPSQLCHHSSSRKSPDTEKHMLLTPVGGIHLPSLSPGSSWAWGPRMNSSMELPELLQHLADGDVKGMDRFEGCLNGWNREGPGTFHFRPECKQVPGGKGDLPGTKEGTPKAVFWGYRQTKALLSRA